MDKIKVNNQVVSMRKFVKQAKIFAINKCTKQIKFLENRKGNEEQMAKSKRKLQRFLEEVNILKKIQPDSVSKLALSKAKDWKAVLAEKNVPLEDRCYAMLANHPPVQEAVDKFHNDNDELVPKIPELLKHWEEKRSRSSQISKKKQKGSQNNASGSNAVPIENKNNFHKSNQAQTKRQRTESLGKFAGISDIKSIKNSSTEKSLTVENTTKEKKNVDIFVELDPTSNLIGPIKSQSLVVDDSKSNESDDSLSDSSDFGKNHISQTEKLQIRNKTNSNESDSSDFGDHHISQTKKKLPVSDKTSSNESNDSLSDSSDFGNHHISQPKEKLLISNKSDEPNDSLSDIGNHHTDQAKEKLPTSDETKSRQITKNLKQSKSFIRNHQTESTVTKKSTKKEAVGDHNSESNVESNKIENSGNLHDIRSKLLKISMSNTEVQSKPRNKMSSVVYQLNADVETDSDNEGSKNVHEKLSNSAIIDNANETKPSFPTKPEVKNKIKAITMLDLNELQNVEEIPIEKSDSDAEEDETDEDSGKQKKDPFFLRDGEPVSESDDEENSEKESARKRSLPPFKKKQFGNLNRKERRGNSFQKGKFEKHSIDGRSLNFRENRFGKNKKDLSFKDNNRSFKRAFDDNSEFRQNKNFKFASKDKFNSRDSANNFAKNPKEEFRQNRNFKFASKDKFNNQNGANNFAKNPKEEFRQNKKFASKDKFSNQNNFTKSPKEKTFSQNHSKDSKRNSYPSKPSLSNTPKTVNDDKPLHPSWEAKKKLKEAAALKFQGKRMVFND